MSEQGLFSDILENPGDDTPRLVYADWLEEYGDESDHARAEFIRLQVRRATLAEGMPEAEAIEQSEKNLLRRHGSGWDVELRALVSSVKYRRGFIEVICPYSTFEEDANPALTDFPGLAPQIWELAPVRRLELWETDKPLQRVLSCDRLGRLAELVCEVDLYSPEEVRAVASSPYLRQLTYLSFAAKEAADEAVAELIAAPWPSLRWLSFSCIDLRRAADALTRSALLAQLTNLDCCGKENCLEAARLLADCPALAGLVGLSFGEDDEGTATFLRSPHLRSLRHLHLSHSELGAGAAAALANAPWLDSLLTLDLYYNRLRTAGSRALAEVRPANLSTLDLGCNELNTSAINELAARMRWPKLDDLGLSHNHLEDDAIVALAGSPLLAPVSKLNLIMNHIGPKGARALAKSPYLDKLRSLRLGGNRIGSEGLAALAASSALPGLEELDVGGNGIDDEGVQTLARSALLARLRKFDLGRNAFGTDALRVLLDALTGSVFDSLDVSECKFGDEGAKVLANAPALASLSFLNISYNAITDAGGRLLLNSPYLARIPHVEWDGNAIVDQELLAALHERFPE